MNMILPLRGNRRLIHFENTEDRKILEIKCRGDVVASYEGNILWAPLSKSLKQGYWFVIEHENRICSVYSHLGKPLNFAVGDKIERGQILIEGYDGILHFEVRDTPMVSRGNYWEFNEYTKSRHPALYIPIDMCSKDMKLRNDNNYRKGFVYLMDKKIITDIECLNYEKLLVVDFNASFIRTIVYRLIAESRKSSNCLTEFLGDEIFNFRKLYLDKERISGELFYELLCIVGRNHM